MQMRVDPGVDENSFRLGVRRNLGKCRLNLYFDLHVAWEYRGSLIGARKGQHPCDEVLHPLIVIEDTIEPTPVFLRRSAAHAENLNAGLYHSNGCFQFMGCIAQEA